MCAIAQALLALQQILGNDVVPDKPAAHDIFALEFNIGYAGHLPDDVDEPLQAVAFLFPGQVRLPEITAEHQPAILADTGNDSVEFLEVAVGKLIDYHVTVVECRAADERGGDELDDIF